MFGRKQTMMKRIKSTICAAAAIMLAAMASCDKVSPLGVLVSGTGVNDRVDMSATYYMRYMNDSIDMQAPGNGEYSFLVGSDSHVTTDPGRINEMIDSGLAHGDLLFAHLGDIADTKAKYYITLDSALDNGKWKYISTYFKVDTANKRPNLHWYDTRYPHGEENPRNSYTIDDFTSNSSTHFKFPFFPVVGNHDITHNGWALYTSIFHSSFYEFTVRVGNTDEYDHFIFLDTANGTLGEKQVEYIEEGLLKTDKPIRHTFVFSHTNLFRPSSNQFASTFPREEMYYLFNKFEEWGTDIMFCGHVHKWDDRTFGTVHYLTLESMSERNSPNPGDYLVRVTCKTNGELKIDRVRMNYTAKK